MPGTFHGLFLCALRDCIPIIANSTIIEELHFQVSVPIGTAIWGNFFCPGVSRYAMRVGSVYGFVHVLV